MSKITKPISQRSYELIRDRIVEILVDEYDNQNQLTYDSDIELVNIYRERSHSIDIMNDSPAIVVSLASGGYDNKNQGSSRGSYVFNIDHYTYSPSTVEDSGDTLASVLLQKLMGITMAILEDPVYRVLGFSSPRIMHTMITDINIKAYNPNEDAKNSAMGRLTFNVVAEETTKYLDAILIDGYDTTVRIDDSGKGYFYQKEVSVEEIIKPFIFTVDTTKAGSANDTIVLPIVPGAINITIEDWGDGTSETVLTGGALTHVYSAPGIYQIEITGSWTGLKFANIGDKLKMKEIKQWGDLTWTIFNQIFMGCTNLTTSYIDKIKRGTVTNFSFSAMIYNCALWTGKINDWDYTGATSYQELAFGCTSINEYFGDLPLADIPDGGSGLTNMLANTGLSSANIDATLNGWAAQAPNIPTGVVVTLTPNGRTSASDAAVTLLTGTYLWTITT